MFAVRSPLLSVSALSLAAIGFAAGCGSAPADATGSALVMQNDPPTTNAPPPGNTPPPKQTDPVPPPADATPDAGTSDGGPSPDAGPTTCNLPNAYAATLADPVINKGGVNYGPGGPSSGFYFRPTTTSHAVPMGQSESLLFLEVGDVLGGPSNEIAPTGYKQIGGCTQSSNIVSCAANEYFQLFGNEKAGNAFRIVSLTQTHNPKFGYGGFDLIQIDPKSGATTRFGRYTTASGPPSIYATALATYGDDVVIVGESNVTFTGESGTDAGKYFRMTFAGFLAPTCDGGTVSPSSITRAPSPLNP